VFAWRGFLAAFRVPHTYDEKKPINLWGPGFPGIESGS
jgi:hypothetical protein